MAERLSYWELDEGNLRLKHTKCADRDTDKPEVLSCHTSTDSVKLRKLTDERDTKATRCPSNDPDLAMETDLQCPICLELFTYPIILPCSHVLCRSPCAEHLFDFNFIRCPVCRDNCYVSGGINSLPRVLTLENIVQRFKQQREAQKPEVNVSTSHESKARKKADKKCCQATTGTNKYLSSKNCSTENQTTTNEERGPSVVTPEPESRDVTFSPPLVTPNSANGLCCMHPESHVTHFCQDCLHTCCVRCRDMESHTGHKILSINQAYALMKGDVEENSRKLQKSYSQLVTSLKSHKDRLKDSKKVVNKHRDDVNTHCDALVAEVEARRSYFLSDLDFEERRHLADTDDLVQVMHQIQGASQALLRYTDDILNDGPSEFLEVAGSLSEKLVKSALDCEAANLHDLTEPLGDLPEKVVDFRFERQVIRNLQYLAVPSTPVIDVTRCSRSENKVLLVVAIPTSIYDVIDQYEIHFCSEEQKRLEIEETLRVKNIPWGKTSGRTVSGSPSHVAVILLENLCPGTPYYFCVAAVNMAGKSLNSDVVQCFTLQSVYCVVPAPVIVESLCRTFPTSIQIYCSGPQDVAMEQQLSYFLLFRERRHEGTWHTLALFGGQEHRAFGLEESTEYEFLVMASNTRGESQISNKVMLKTDEGTS